ncbi:helix-turn-helix domain-containing protein [Spirosoma rhododendri]|uniref:Helix-turn-helix transcriptional regulator n=1 Tax=Spirosoma rhododendri TaxID=2728024 RepID=A0A7L5DNY5_9BACT|nr:AraC family transcriptional regulator [Spirosoma rhododendri]QJD80106.1 helix-turn-helix transcriptional regulator [Spirosoma rhododendri]
MESPQHLADFYRERLNYVPDTVTSVLGHLNVFDMADFSGPYAKPIFYTRKNYFKISLLTGKKKLSYADKVITIDQHALIFSNPLIPYNWELLEEAQSGFFCIFTQSFFAQFGGISQYPVFQPGQIPVFPLDDAQQRAIEPIYQDMLQEIRSDYAYKQDRLRNLAFELIHRGLKMTPATVATPSDTTANSRIAALFVELLERQFPLEPSAQMVLQTPSAFASQLAVHVNHLNRALKTVMGKTTSQVISERVASEAAFLLTHTTRPISEIAWCLGFDDPSSFVHFFKKAFAQPPRSFRNQSLV